MQEMTAFWLGFWIVFLGGLLFFYIKKFDLNKINKYVEEDNELDKQMKVVLKKINKYGKTIEELEKEVAILQKDSHSPVKNLEKRLKKIEKNK